MSWKTLFDRTVCKICCVCCKNNGYEKYKKDTRGATDFIASGLDVVNFFRRNRMVNIALQLTMGKKSIEKTRLLFGSKQEILFINEQHDKDLAEIKKGNIKRWDQMDDINGEERTIIEKVRPRAFLQEFYKNLSNHARTDRESPAEESP